MTKEWVKHGPSNYFCTGCRTKLFELCIWQCTTKHKQHFDRFGTLHWNWYCYNCGDLDGNGTITFGDIQKVLDAWDVYDECADADSNGTITFGDIQVVLDNWETGCVGQCAP